MNELIQTVLIYALPVIFAITLHEAAHGYAAKYFGDTTAFSQGRLSLNPLVHIDPIGTILIPVVLYFATGGSFLFGYAKPVPVNFSRLKNPKRDMAWVALAGPAANFAMAFAWMLFGAVLQAADIDEAYFNSMAKAGLLTNLVMMAFNLFPVPPLDGGRILVSLLPYKLAYKFAQIEPYGFFIVMGLVVLHVLQFWMLPVMVLTSSFLSLLLTPFSFLLGL
ncbi:MULTISPECIES: site-2 protease family protein [unclassified Undibacterium]|jgi:Zn-dependent protease|uniref:site-2 protease family protein n=1 Tax=unclassified Undibacterium TaxID=2630295 RepID=UPI00164BCEC1|nr:MULTISPECIES: site-2 protease family protein [unclassified Undibacterium]MBC3876893.1 site-2 protease family protein [Undibacterium sp. FT79W]MBC3928559.1 site-2 protease family protein [Undibacterium sp. CY21W]MBK1891682.1 site-2 protease family protein [Undibacterium sp. 14-3-2]